MQLSLSAAELMSVLVGWDLTILLYILQECTFCNHDHCVCKPLCLQALGFVAVLCISCVSPVYQYAGRTCWSSTLLSMMMAFLVVGLAEAIMISARPRPCSVCRLPVPPPPSPPPSPPLLAISPGAPHWASCCLFSLLNPA